MRSFHLFVNPAAGGGTAAARGAAVARLLRDAGADVELTYSAGAEQCRQLAAEPLGRGAVIVAVGGDGTVGTLAGTVLRAGGTLGLVPAGRGNDFARQLGLPVDPELVARVLLTGRVHDVDVIHAADRIVVGSVYAGIDSLTSDLVNSARLLPRSLQYPYASLRAIATHRPARYTVTIDGVEHHWHAHTVIVANSGYYGSGMHMAPPAAVDDGVLDVVVITAVSRLQLVRLMRRVYDGSHVELDGVALLTGREVTVASTGTFAAYGDGERVAPLPVTARVLPGALRILV